jgi:hypothetical protein
MGIALAALSVQGWDGAYDFSKVLGAIGENPTVSIAIFIAFLLVPLYSFGTAKPKS